MSSTAAPRKRLSRAARSTQLHDVALTLARAGGLRALTLRAIANEAGVAAGLVAHYAPPMDELVATVFGELVDAELAELRKLGEHHPEPTARLRSTLDTLLDGSRRDITAVWADAYSLGRDSPAIANAVRIASARWIDFAAALLAAASTGDRPVSAVRETAAQFVGMLDGLGAQSLVDHGSAAANRALLARILEAELDLPAGALAPAAAASRKGAS